MNATGTSRSLRDLNQGSERLPKTNSYNKRYGNFLLGLLAIGGLGITLVQQTTSLFGGNSQPRDGRRNNQ